MDSIVLASKSPRRREILQKLNIPFIVFPAKIKFVTNKMLIHKMKTFFFTFFSIQIISQSPAASITYPDEIKGDFF